MLRELMPLAYEDYATQKETWPAAGRHILAQYDDRTVIVYQAYLPEIAAYAVQNQRFGGPAFSFARMSWVKPNFLWMMFRSGWGTKPGQEATLAVRIRREAFDEILAAAVPSSFSPETCEDVEQWKAALARSEVRLQWDPDHDPAGHPVERRAIQLGLRGEILRRYATEWVVEIEDVSTFVSLQRRRLYERSAIETPKERVYNVRDTQTAGFLRVSSA